MKINRAKLKNVFRYLNMNASYIPAVPIFWISTSVDTLCWNIAKFRKTVLSKDRYRTRSSTFLHPPLLFTKLEVSINMSYFVLRLATKLVRKPSKNFGHFLSFLMYVSTFSLPQQMYWSCVRIRKVEISTIGIRGHEIRFLFQFEL